jgi:hypothetical protein
VQVVCAILLENFWQGLYFISNFSSIKNMRKKLWASKIAGVPIVGSPGTKWHLGVGLVARHIEYYKGEGDGFPSKSRLWWVLWVHVARVLFVHQKCSNYALTNLLFGLCKSMWIIDPFVTCPSLHLGAPTCPSIPKVLWAKERTLTPCPFVISALDS